MLNIVDVIIILLILSGAVAGFKNGFTKQVLSFIGFLAVVFISFKLKNSVSVLMYQYLPFFSFGGIFKGIVVLNIIVYEVLAFIIVFSVLLILLKVLLLFSSIVEKVFDLTIILGIFSKILGAIVGMIEYYIFVFICLYILSLPIFDNQFLENSKYKDKILKNTPVLNTFVDKTLDVIDEFALLREKYEVSKDSNTFNLETLDVFLKNKVITVDNVDNLNKHGKLQINNIESVLLKYRGE